MINTFQSIHSTVPILRIAGGAGASVCGMTPSIVDGARSSNFPRPVPNVMKMPPDRPPAPTSKLDVDAGLRMLLPVGRSSVC
jgi:hypothetical protein